MASRRPESPHRGVHPERSAPFGLGLLGLLGLFFAQGCLNISNPQVLCAEAADTPLEDGPDCDPDSFFPMCTGAHWTYSVKDESTNGLEDRKSWSILGQARDLVLTFDDGEATHERLLTEAWSFCRSTEEDVRQAWLSRSEQTLYWENTTWFGVDGTGRKDTWYEPRRIRLLDPPGDAAEWVDYYTELEREADSQGTATATDYRVTWSIATPPEGSGVDDPAFGGREYTCQHSDTDTWDTENEEWTDDEEATFCFVHGVGKVFERTEGDVDEWLVEWEVPGIEGTREAGPGG